MAKLIIEIGIKGTKEEIEAHMLKYEDVGTFILYTTPGRRIMAKLIIEIEIKGKTKEELEAHMLKHKDDWFPSADKGLVAVDESYLTVDPQDDSFYLFRLKSVE